MSKASQLLKRLQPINEALKTKKPTATSINESFKAEKCDKDGKDTWCVKDDKGEVVADDMTEQAAKDEASTRNGGAS